MDLILGSQSPRRKEILEFFKLPFKQIPSQFDEEAVPFSGNPYEYVKILSEGKARALSVLYPDSVILCADTVVFQKGKIFNKPKDVKEAYQFLKTFAGEWQSVISAVTTCKDGHLHTEIEETRLLINSLTDEQIQRYHSVIHALDKSGGFGVEKTGSIIVNRIDGCYYNILGLPINATKQVLKAAGIDLWDYL